PNPAPPRTTIFTTTRGKQFYGTLIRHTLTDQRTHKTGFYCRRSDSRTLLVTQAPSAHGPALLIDVDHDLVGVGPALGALDAQIIVEHREHMDRGERDPGGAVVVPAHPVDVDLQVTVVLSAGEQSLRPADGRPQFRLALVGGPLAERVVV